MLNTYGEYGNAKLLSCYAFALPANIFDAVRMPPLAAAATAAVGARAARARARWIRGILRAGPGPEGGGVSRAARAALRRALSAAERGWIIKARHRHDPPPSLTPRARRGRGGPTRPPRAAHAARAAPPATPASSSRRGGLRSASASPKRRSPPPQAHRRPLLPHPPPPPLAV